MSKLNDALKQITDPAVADAKAEFQQLIADGKVASQDFVKASARQLEGWIVDLSKKELSAEEFEELVGAQKILAKNFLLSQSLAARKRAEKLTVNVLNLAATKIAPILLAAI